MTSTEIRAVLEQAFAPSISTGEFSAIQVQLNEAIERNCNPEDVDAYQLLLNNMLIKDGRRRYWSQVHGFVPVIIGLCGFRGTERLAEIP